MPTLYHQTVKLAAHAVTGIVRPLEVFRLVAFWASTATEAANKAARKGRVVLAMRMTLNTSSTGRAYFFSRRSMMPARSLWILRRSGSSSTALCHSSLAFSSLPIFLHR